MSGGSAQSGPSCSLPSFPPLSVGSGGTVGSTVFRPPSPSAAAGSSSLRLAPPCSPYRSRLSGRRQRTTRHPSHLLSGVTICMGACMTAAAATAAAAAAARQYHDGYSFGAVDGARAFAGETDAEFAARLALPLYLVADAPGPAPPPPPPQDRHSNRPPPPTRLAYSAPLCSPTRLLLLVRTRTAGRGWSRCRVCTRRRLGSRTAGRRFQSAGRGRGTHRCCERSCLYTTRGTTRKIYDIHQILNLGHEADCENLCVKRCGRIWVTYIRHSSA